MTRTVETEKDVPHMSPMTGSSWSLERHQQLPVRERHKGASGTHARCLCLMWIQLGGKVNNCVQRKLSTLGEAFAELLKHLEFYGNFIHCYKAKCVWR